MVKVIRWYFWFILLCTVSFASCKRKVESVSPRIEKITESVYASGHIRSDNQYQVYPAVNGILQEMYVKEGDEVKKGAPLFLVRNESVALNVENAELAAAYADWNTQGERLSEAKTAMGTAANVKANDSILLARQQRLWEQGIQSKVMLEQRELAYANAVNAYKAALARYNDLKKQLNLVADQSKKQVAISQAQAKDFTVRSQLNGRIYSITKEPGEIVNTQNPIALIGDAKTFLVELQIDENDIQRIKSGQRVLLTMDSYKGRVFEAIVSKLDLIMNERTRTFAIEATFVEQPPVLYPLLTVEANIVIEEKDNAMLIPRTYLIGDSMVLLADKTSRRVEVGLRDYQMAEIRSGLTKSDVLLKPER